jgi:hypothetical protein
MNRAFWFLMAATALSWGTTMPCHAGTARNFAQWEQEIAGFERSDATNPPPRHAILFIGSSTIRLWHTLTKDFPGQKTINRGFGGSHIADATHFADRIVFPYAPRAVFLRAGGNDLNAGKPVAEVFADYQAFVAAVHSRLPNTQIFFIGLCPSPSRWEQHDKERELNHLVALESEHSPNLKYIETYDMVLGSDGRPRPELFVADRLHFNPAGYQLLAGKVRPYIPKQ